MSSYPGTCDETRPQSVIAHCGDGGLVSVERYIALSTEQVEDAHGSILVAHGDVVAVGGGAQVGHLMFDTLQDQHLVGGREIYREGR